MSKHEKKKIMPLSRRQMLAIAGAGVMAPFVERPVQLLLQGMVDGFISKAQAEAGMVKPRNYLHINMGGGPARWMFDLPLLPYTGRGTMTPNSAIFTGFAPSAGPNAGAPAYLTTSLNVQGTQVSLPILWACNIPTSSGGNVPMAQLLESMLMIRGLNQSQDGHDGNAIRQVRPNNSAPSLNGLVADSSTAPVPAVALPHAPLNSYYSAKGIGLPPLPDYVSGIDPLTALLSPFSRTPDKLNPDFMSRRLAMESAVNQAVSALGTYAMGRDPGSIELFRQRMSAEKVMKSAIGDLSATYSSLYMKYRNLITASMSTPIPGLTDKPILSSSLLADSAGGAKSSLRISGHATGSANLCAGNEDLRTLITASTYITGIAESMAIAEYLMVNGYSSTVMAGSNSVTGLNVMNGILANSADAGFSVLATEAMNWGYDEHDGGSVAGSIVMSCGFRALAACLYEFISVMKAKGLYEETVIQIGGDFARTPQLNTSSTGLGGTGHGWNGSCTSIFSGAVKKFNVIGNIFANDTNPQSLNTWGLAAPLDINGNTQFLSLAHVTTTVSKLLRVQSPFSNSSSLLEEQASGEFTPVIELAKNV